MPGKFGSALDFDGSGDYVTLPGGVGSSITNKITISAWVNVDTGDADRFAIYDVYKYTVTKNKSVQLRVNTDETIRFFVSSDGENDDSLETVDTIDTNWHHLAVTFDAGAAIIYIDGQESISDTLSHTSINTTGITEYIGTYFYASEYAKGQIDHVLLYNRALSASEIALLYREPFAMVSDTGASSITGATWNASGKYNSALDFDGNDYVHIGDTGQAVKAVSLWVKPNAVDVIEEPLDLDGTHYVKIDNGTVTGQGFASPTVYINGISGASTITTGWNHIVITTGTGIDADDLDIGRLDDSNYFAGLIDEVKIYNYEPTAEQVKLDYNQGSALRFGD